MEPFTILALILIFSTAIIFSPLGLGGGLIFMPILHYIMEWEIKTAILGSLILVWSVSQVVSLLIRKEVMEILQWLRKGCYSEFPVQ